MSGEAIYSFRLFIAADGHNSMEAIANLNAICRQHLTGRHKTEIVDVFQHPGRAQAEGILMTPTLLKLTPLPLRRIIGTLSETEKVLQALGLMAPIT